MRRKAFAEKMAERAGLTTAQAEQALTAFIETVGDVLAGGDKVQLTGFGTFELRTQAARIARNPQNGEKIEVGEKRIPSFKAGTTFKGRF